MLLLGGYELWHPLVMVLRRDARCRRCGGRNVELDGRASYVTGGVHRGFLGLLLSTLALYAFLFKSSLPWKYN